MAEETKIQVPYVPYQTFNSAIEQMEHTLPPKLDKTMWPSYSGAIQTQLWSALRFFNLVNADGTPTETLAELVRDKPNRKGNLQSLLRTYYPSLMALDLSKATLGHFNGAMKEFGLSPETQKKASSFFLQAAKASGMELSKFILSNTRTPGIKRTKRNTGTRQKGNGISPALVIPAAQFGSGPSLTIQLERGITLTLAASHDTFKMAGPDREFVLQLLTQIEDYSSDATDGTESDEDGEEADDNSAN
jgi:hypothetical protein